jgi:hypothetical protein
VGKKAKATRQKSRPSAGDGSRGGLVSLVISPALCMEAVEAAVKRLRGESRYLSHEVIVVGPPDGAGLLVDGYGDVLLVEATGNAGAMWNAGVGAASGDRVLVLDPDVEMREGSLRALVKIAREDGIGVVGGRIVSPAGPLVNAGFEFDPRHGFAPRWQGNSPTFFGALQQAHVAAVDFGAALITRGAFDAAGGFDESFSSARFAGMDFCLRVRVHGLRVALCPSCTAVDHRAAATDPSGEVDPVAALQELTDMERVQETWERADGAGDELISQVREYGLSHRLDCARRLRDLGVSHPEEVLRLVGMG